MSCKIINVVLFLKCVEMFNEWFCFPLKMDDIKFEVEEQKALAKSRLEELETLQVSQATLTKEYERLKLEVCLIKFTSSAN